ncbi:hypothetical protein GN956_G4144 [Arapaima gigas]
MLWAPLGRQIKNGNVRLNIQGCTSANHQLPPGLLLLAVCCAATCFLIGAGPYKILARRKQKMPSGL